MLVTPLHLLTTRSCYRPGTASPAIQYLSTQTSKEVHLSVLSVDVLCDGGGRVAITARAIDNRKNAIKHGNKTTHDSTRQFTRYLARQRSILQTPTPSTYDRTKNLRNALGCNRTAWSASQRVPNKCQCNCSTIQMHWSASNCH